MLTQLRSTVKLNWPIVILLFFVGLGIFTAFGLVVYLMLEREDIHYAAREGDVGSIKEILDRKPSRLEQRDRLRLTPLLYATWHGQTEALRVLIERGANVNATCSLSSHDGEWNGLHLAANFGRIESAIVLLDAGTMVNHLSLKGETPMDVAIRNDEKAVADLLGKNGGKTAAQLTADKR